MASPIGLLVLTRVLIIFTSDRDAHINENHLCMLRSRSIPFKNYGTFTHTKSDQNESCYVFQHFTPVQKDEYKKSRYMKPHLWVIFLVLSQSPQKALGLCLQHLLWAPLRQQRLFSAEKLTSQMKVFSLPTKHTSEHRTRDHTTARISQQIKLAFFML